MKTAAVLALVPVMVLCVGSPCHAVAAAAGTYANTAFDYSIALPPGWAASSDGTANPAVLTHAGGDIQLKIFASKKPAAMDDAAGAQLKSGDEAAMARKYPAHKAVALTGGKLAERPTLHYGFLYRSERGVTQVARFAAASVPRASDHLWVKMQAVFPKDHFKAASDHVAAVMAAFKVGGVAAPAAAIVEPAPPRPDAAAVPPKTGGGGESGAATSTPPPSSSDGDAVDFTSAYAGQTKDLNAKDSKTFVDSFKGSGTRTAEEEERARQLGLGGVFKPAGNK